MNPKRKQAEELIYRVMDKLDKSGKNSDYYKQKFSGMTDEEFVDFVSGERPFRFQYTPFEIEPTLSEIDSALKVMGVPMLEKINLGYLYRDKDGNPVQSLDCLTVYLHVKRMKQMLTEKIHVGADISKRDMKTGRSISDSKGGQTTDREFESLAVHGLDASIDELSRPRADAMIAKDYMNTAISTKGYVSKDEIPIKKSDSLANNLLDAYLIGCHIKSNLITDDDYFISTLLDKKNKIERE